MKSIVIALFLGVILLLSSCSPLYVPNSVNIPLLKNEGDLNFGANAGENGFDLQASMAVTDQVALMCNFSLQNSNDKNHKHHFFEGGAGYYHHTSKILIFESYAGAGYGKAEAREPLGTFENPSPNIETANYFKTFLQFNLGLTMDYFDAGISTRFCYLNFHNFETFVYRAIPYGPDLGKTRTAALVESVLFIRVGGKNIKFNSQIGALTPLHKSEYLSVNPWILNVGLSFHLNAFYE